MTDVSECKWLQLGRLPYQWTPFLPTDYLTNVVECKLRDQPICIIAALRPPSTLLLGVFDLCGILRDVFEIPLRCFTTGYRADIRPSYGTFIAIRMDHGGYLVDLLTGEHRALPYWGGIAWAHCSRETLKLPSVGIGLQLQQHCIQLVQVPNAWRPSRHQLQAKPVRKIIRELMLIYYQSQSCGLHKCPNRLLRRLFRFIAGAGADAAAAGVPATDEAEAESPCSDSRSDD